MIGWLLDCLDSLAWWWSTVLVERQTGWNWIVKSKLWLTLVSSSSFQLCEGRACQEEVCLLALNYMDRYLIVCEVRKNHLQLLAAACLLLASKLREPSCTSLTADILVYFTDNSITKIDLIVSIFRLLGTYEVRARGQWESGQARDMGTKYFCCCCGMEWKRMEKGGREKVKDSGHNLNSQPLFQSIMLCWGRLVDPVINTSQFA